MSLSLKNRSCLKIPTKKNPSCVFIIWREFNISFLRQDRWKSIPKKNYKYPWRRVTFPCEHVSKWGAHLNINEMCLGNQWDQLECICILCTGGIARN